MEKIYDPAEPYAVLTDKSATPEVFIDLLINQTAPQLPNQVIHGEGKQECVTGILNVFSRLKERWVKHLRDLGFEKAADFVERSKRLPSLAEVLRKIPTTTPKERDDRHIVQELLEGERDSMDSEILRYLGFLPLGVFVSANGKLLQDHLPEHIKSRQTDPQKLLSQLSTQDLLQYPMYERLREWMADAEKEFGECVRYAYFNITKLLDTVSPEGIDSQPYGQFCDIETKSLTALLVAVFDKTRPLVVRFESLRLLEEAIRLFSIKRNPVYRAQQETRKQIHTVLQTDSWDTSGKLCPIAIAGDLIERVRREEGQEALVDNKETPVNLKARYVNERVRSMLEDHSNLIRSGHTDRLLFDSGEKTPASFSVKMVLMQELARKCQACLDGAQTDLDKKYAQRKLREMKRVLEAHGKNLELFDIKPITFDALDDHVRFRMAVDLIKFLEDYDLEDVKGRDHVDEFFTKWADFIADQLNLTDIRMENHLWRSNSDNLKSNSNYRVFKLHGKYKVKGEIFENGRLVERDILVPVEMQLLPIESYLRLSGHGPTSTHRYSARKARDLIGRLRPASIGGRRLYDEKIDIEDITRAVEE